MQRSSKSIFCITGILLCYLCVGNPYQNALKEFARDMRRVSHARTLLATKTFETFAELINIPSQDLQEMYKGMPRDARHELERVYYLKMGKFLSPKAADFKFEYSLSEIADMGYALIDSFKRGHGASVKIYPHHERKHAAINSIQGLDQFLSKGLCGLNKIVVLDLSDNRISELSVGTFKSLIKLRKLYLNNNMITLLFARTFEGLSNLEVLNLSDNNITQLPDGVFFGLELDVLKLERNPFAGSALNLEELEKQYPQLFQKSVS